MTQSLQWRIGLVAAVLATCVFLLYPSVGPVPEFWSKYLPNSPVRLGLDLQGGQGFFGRSLVKLHILELIQVVNKIFSCIR